MTIVELKTSFLIEDVKEDIKAAIDIMDDLTAIDYDGVSHPLGYSYDPIKSTLKVPKGYTLQKIQSKMKEAYTYEKIELDEPVPNDVGWTVNKTPYDYQVTIIDTVIRAFEKGHTQHIIDLIGGKGKTLTALFIAAKMNVPTLVICKSIELIKQWVDGMLFKTDLKLGDIYQLKGSGCINYVESMSYTHPVYIVTHATVRSIINTYGYKLFNKMLIKMGVGLKIIDEFDTEFKNIMDIDLNTFISYNIYLTATTYKNSKSEDKVFQNAFKSVRRIGGDMFKHEKPNRICEWVKFKSAPTPDQRVFVYNYKANEFNAYRYNDYLFLQKRDTVLIPLLKPYINRFKETSKKQDTCVIYCEKKESCNIMQEILITTFGILAKDIGIVNSDVDDYNKKSNMGKKYICTTAKSMGRGIDVTTMTMGINLEQYAGTSIFEQQVYRLGRVGADEGTYINFIDTSFHMIENWNSGKLDYTDDLFKEFTIKYLSCSTGEFVTSVRDL